MATTLTHRLQLYKLVSWKAIAGAKGFEMKMSYSSSLPVQLIQSVSFSEDLGRSFAFLIST